MDFAQFLAIKCLIIVIQFHISFSTGFDSSPLLFVVVFKHSISMKIRGRNRLLKSNQHQSKVVVFDSNYFRLLVIGSDKHEIVIMNWALATIEIDDVFSRRIHVCRSGASDTHGQIALGIHHRPVSPY
jgi:hypothetical protein